MHWTIISGTNRPQSNTLKVSNFIKNLMEEKTKGKDKIELIDLQNLPPEIFLGRAYQEKPAEFEPFKKAVLNADGLICVLPEYNGAAPGVFKYFIDMLPFPQSLQKVPSCFVGVSAGRFGALRSIEQSQQVFRYRNAFLYPESLYLMGVPDSLDPTTFGPKDEFLQKLTHQVLDGFLDFARKLRS